MRWHTNQTVWIATLLLLVVSACGESAESSLGERGSPPRPPRTEVDDPPPPSPGDPIAPDGASAPNLGQAGAQDIGELRQVLESGRIPGPNVLDEIGFFNVHRLDLPSPACGDDICLHGLLGSMGNMVNGAACTVVLIGMNTPIDPSALPRPAMDLVVAVDSSSSAAPHVAALRDGLTGLLGELGPDDTLSLVTYADSAHLLIDAAGPEASDVPALLQLLQASGGSDLYAGLRLAFEQAATLGGPGRQARLLVASSGAPTRGIAAAGRLEDMAAGFTGGDVGLTLIGIGAADGELLRGVAQATAGNYLYFADATELAAGFADELATFLVPLAEDVRISISGGADYWLGRIHGATDSTLLSDQTGVIEIPALYLAQRTNAEPPPPGGRRRGGGGGIVVELIPIGVQDAANVGQLTLEYRQPDTDELHVQQVPITASVDANGMPAVGVFETDSVEKAFVMLNLYVGFEMAAERAASADLLGALDILVALEVAVGAWLDDNPDGDIADDYGLLQLFVSNLEAEWARWVAENPNLEGTLGAPPARPEPGSDQPPPPPPRPRPNPWPSD